MFLLFDGDLEAVTYEKVLRENPFLAANSPLYHSNKKYGLNWGINLNLLSHSNVTVGFSIADYKDFYFYQNNSSDISRFNILYDPGSTTRMNFYTEWAYSIAKTFNISIRADYFKYNTTELPEAWHRPRYKTTFNFRYNIHEKIVFGSDIYLMGGIRAYDFAGGTAIDLRNIADINFNVNYLFSERFGVFVDFENILGRNYERYYRYPNRGMQILAGITFNF
jgi:hypothetical protein